MYSAARKGYNEGLDSPGLLLQLNQPKLLVYPVCIYGFFAIVKCKPLL